MPVTDLDGCSASFEGSFQLITSEPKDWDLVSGVQPEPSFDRQPSSRFHGAEGVVDLGGELGPSTLPALD